MPPTSTALFVVTIVACIWAAVIFISGYVVASAGLVGVAIGCAALGVAKRKQAVRGRT